MKSLNDKILLGNSLPLPEEDPDDKSNEEDYATSSLHCYWFNSILENINKPLFKTIYYSVIHEIKNECSFEEQRGFCFSILETIAEEYDFQFIKNLQILSNIEVNQIYEFLEFLEFNNENFLSYIWSSLDINSLKSNEQIKNYCIEKSFLILEKIDKSLFFLNQLIISFLGTYIKLITWFIKNSIKNRTSILFNILSKRGKKNE